MRTALSILCLAVLLACSSRVSAGVPPEEAAKHVGETVTVEGVVSSTHTSGRGNVFLDFGGKYPHEVFTAYVPAAAAASWPEANLKSLLALAGKSVQVTGKIAMYKGKPEIVLDQRSQVTP